jgi:hypothetical protein
MDEEISLASEFRVLQWKRLDILPPQRGLTNVLSVG